MLTWLALALVSAIIEVSIPHFGFAFVGAGAFAAAADGVSWLLVPMQLGDVRRRHDRVARRAALGARQADLGQGWRSRRGPSTLVGRHGTVTHDIDPTLGTGRVNVGGEDWAARSTEPIAAGTKVRVVGADGIVLEVTRA